MESIHHLMPFRVLSVFAIMVCLFGSVAARLAHCNEAPEFRAPVSGDDRIRVGDFEVIALSDGINKRLFEQQLQMLQGNKEEIRALLAAAYPNDQIETTVNAFLINTGAKLILVDTGNGKMGSPTMGNVISNLRAAGYQPEKIDEIYLTHMHVDHIGGLVSEGERAFPNATVYADKAEADHWLSDSNLNAAPPEQQRSYQLAKAAIAPYLTAGKFKTFAGDTQLSPGIRSKSLFGHTPGHTAYVIESKGETLVLWGDVVHVAAVQFTAPSVTISFDSDKADAAKTRQQILREAADNGWLIGGAHLAFPGVGHVRANQDGGYVFLPLDRSDA